MEVQAWHFATGCWPHQHPRKVDGPGLSPLCRGRFLGLLHNRRRRDLN
jgi:hypothetical protein